MGLAPASRKDETEHRSAPAMLCESCFAGRLQARERSGIQLLRAMSQLPDDFPRQVVIVHSSIPFCFSMAARAWVAREQWVLTLPSEHPIADAVSATSISSQ